MSANAPAMRFFADPIEPLFYDASLPASVHAEAPSSSGSIPLLPDDGVDATTLADHRLPPPRASHDASPPPSIHSQASSSSDSIALLPVDAVDATVPARRRLPLLSPLRLTDGIKNPTYKHAAALALSGALNSAMMYGAWLGFAACPSALAFAGVVIGALTVVHLSESMLTPYLGVEGVAMVKLSAQTAALMALPLPARFASFGPTVGANPGLTSIVGAAFSAGVAATGVAIGTLGESNQDLLLMASSAAAAGAIVASAMGIGAGLMGLALGANAGRLLARSWAVCMTGMLSISCSRTWAFLLGKQTSEKVGREKQMESTSGLLCVSGVFDIGLQLRALKIV